MKRVLLVVDMQRDFMPSGAVPVPGADALVPVINQLMRDAARGQHFDVCLATKDWHPPDHISFTHQHPGAQPGALAPTPSGATPSASSPPTVWLEPRERSLLPCCAEGLEVQHVLRGFHKGEDPGRESHSGLYDLGGGHSTGLPEFLEEIGAQCVCVVGVALEVCVRATVLDCLAEGLETLLLLDAVKPADEEEGQRTLEELRSAGCRLVRVGDPLWQQLEERGQREAGGKVEAAEGVLHQPHTQAAEP